MNINQQSQRGGNVAAPDDVAAARETSATPIGLKGRGDANAASAIPLARQWHHTNEELREKFTQFVGETFYGQMFKAMRSTVGKPAYFHGGRAEEVFQGQLDQTMAEHLTKATASKFAEPMFERQFPHLASGEEPVE